MLGKLLSGDDVSGGWNGSFDAVPTGSELPPGKRSAVSLEPLSKPFPELNSVEGCVVELGKGSFDVVAAGFPNGSLLVEGEVPADSPNVVSAVPGLVFPNGCSLPSSLPMPDGCEFPNSLLNGSLVTPGSFDRAVDDGSFDPPRSNSPVGSEFPVLESAPNASFESELSDVDPNGSLRVVLPN